MLTDAEVDVLRDLGLTSRLSDETRSAALALVARGFVEREGDLFKLTALGLQELMQKGGSRS